MSVGLALAALLAVAAVLAVALPFLREPEATPEEDRLDSGTALERERVRLAEERDQALAALSELEFDHRTGKVSDEDYRAQVGALRARAAATLRALDAAQAAPAGANGAAPSTQPRGRTEAVRVESSRPTG